MLTAGTGPDVAGSHQLEALVLADPWRRNVLEHLRTLDLDAWIVGGFVRNAVWDAREGRGEPTPVDDVDVVLFGEGRGLPRDTEAELAARLSAAAPTVPWSVRDQRRMHVRSGDAAYRCLRDAVGSFPDTASAVAVRLTESNRLEVLAPNGLRDLFAGRVRPTAAARREGDERYTELVARKGRLWRAMWPTIHVETLGRFTHRGPEVE